MERAEEIMEFARAMRVCYRGKTAEACASCPYVENGEACDRVNLLDAADVIEALLARLEAARGAWVPADHEPPPWEDVLVYCQHKDLAPWTSVARLEQINDERAVWVTDSGERLHSSVTHWRALPPDPEQDGEGRELADLLTFARMIGLIPREGETEKSGLV